MRGSEFGGRQVDSRLSFGFRCDKEMKPNPCGFNLNFDEFFDLDASAGVAFRVVADGGVDAGNRVSVWRLVGGQWLTSVWWAEAPELLTRRRQGRTVLSQDSCG